MDPRERRELNNGFGNALSRAVELTVAPVVYGVLGYLLDGWLGTRPLFLVLLFGFAFGYLFWKQYRRYDADMNEEERKLFGGRGTS